MNDWQPDIAPVDNGLRLQIFDEAVPFYLLSDKAEFHPQFDWYEDFFLSVEEYRGQNDVEEDHIYAAHIRLHIAAGRIFDVGRQYRSQS